MATFETPSGRMKAVYGRTKGLVARRKALMLKATLSSNNIIEISSSDESVEVDVEKENERPKTSPIKKRAAKLAAIVSLHSQAISESEDEVVRPSRWDRDERRAKARKEKRRPVVKEIDESEEESDKEREDVEDLAILLAASTLDIGPTTEKVEVDSQPAKEEKTSTRALLSLCGQDKPNNFSQFLYDLEDQAKCSTWRKFGEASFSEVYGLHGSNSVVKIIPLLDDDDDDDTTSEVSLPDRSLPSDVHREIEMTRALAKVSDGFVKMCGAHVVQGPYPYRLLRARTARASKSEESNNASPETFSNSQQYAALVLRNGGEDLESFKDLSWKQAASIFCQIVQTLSLGEESYQFEHRDLHWGNVVIAPVEVEKEDDIDLVKGNQIELFKDASCSGVKATIIDYTLSRATIGKTLIAYDFQDQSLFNGRSDVDLQFEVYRQMRKETNEDWLGFYPHTNILWLNYLASKLIDEKHIPNPKRRSRLDQRGNEELRCRNFLMEVKQLLLSKRMESASDLNKQLEAIDF